MRTVFTGTAVALALGLLAGWPGEASACGGTFCDSGPNAMPVDQTGENVLFVMENGRVEAHVQIQYSGEAARFAWIVPMPKVPEVLVGSQILFDRLLSGSVPTYGYTTTRDQCGNQNGGPGLGAGGSGTGGTAGSGGASGGGPTVVLQKTVGAFEVVVLQGGSASEVSDWLSTSGYQDIPSAPALLQPYVEQSYVFAAFKLTGGAEVSEIHPVVLRYQGDQPCVPLRLTAVAAVEDMGVRTFFLGAERVVPTNYKHVVLNPLKLDWPSFVTNYADAVSNAADSALANGQAFVTEYAGPSNIIQNSGIYDTRWDASKIVDIEPELVIAELEIQGIVMCEPWGCQFMHPLLPGLLEKYLPRPGGVTQEQFYDCLSCFSSQIDRTAWSAAGFAKDYDERIVQPGRHASQVLQRHGYLTRMFTTISPAEMTEDPMFHERGDLEDVPLPTFATRRILCDSDEVYTLPDERQVALASPGSWPDFPTMPWVERVEEIPLDGPPIVLADHVADIDEALASHNRTFGWPPSSGAGGTNGSGSGSGGTLGGDDESASVSPSGGGCALGVSPSTSIAALFGVAAAGLLAARRRRRQSRD